METKLAKIEKTLSIAGIRYAAVVKQAVFKTCCEHKPAGKN